MLETSSLRPPARFALRALPYSLFLYALAILTSMAGMEIFSWLSVALVLTVLISQWDRPLSEGASWLGVDGILMAFLLVTMVGAALADEGSPGFFTIVGRVRWIILYFMIRTGLRWIWSPRLSVVHLGLLGFLGLTGIYAVVQHFTGIDLVRETMRAVLPLTYDGETPVSWRAAGLYSSSMTYGHSAALAVGFPLALVLTGVVTTQRSRWLLTLCGAFLAAGIVASYTRGAWLAGGASLFIVGAFAGKRALAMIILVAGIVLSVAYFALPDVKARMSTFTDPSHQSNRDRWTLWQANWEMFKDHPLVGVGYGENERLVGDYYEKLDLHGLKGHAHNNFLQVLSGTGALGAILFVAMGVYFLFINLRLWWWLPEEWRWERGFALGALGAQIAMHVGGLTECNFKDAEVNHHYMFLMAVLSVIYMNTLAEQGNRIVRPANESRPLNGI